MACPTMPTCSIVSLVPIGCRGDSPSPTPTPTHTEERGDYTLRAFGKNIWGKVSQKVVRTCDKPRGFNGKEKKLLNGSPTPCSDSVGL